MNTIIQSTLVFFALVIAIVFLVRKFVWNPKRKTTSGCNDDGCNCH